MGGLGNPVRLAVVCRCLLSLLLDKWHMKWRISVGLGDLLSVQKGMDQGVAEETDCMSQARV